MSGQLPVRGTTDALDGNDATDGATSEAAWASPSRGTPARITVSYTAGSTVVDVSGTDGFYP